MSHGAHRGWRSMLLLLAVAALVVAAVPAIAKPPAAVPERMTVADVESLGLVTFVTGYEFADTEVGGLSGITYDAQRDIYYVLSDDRSERAPARFYSVSVDVSDGALDAGDVSFVDVTFLRDKSGSVFAEGSVDPESIQMTRPGHLFISSEGDADANPAIDPFVNRFNLAGKQNRALAVPDKYLPDGSETWGIRDNLAFESLTVSPSLGVLYTATENALVQDGPPSTLIDESPARLLEYDLKYKRPASEFVYMVSTIPKDADPPGGFADNGLVDLQALDDAGTLLAMERSYASGVGNTVVLFEASTSGATDVSGDDPLPGSFTPMSKTFVADFEADLFVVPDNLEGMAFGPMLPDGRYLLIVVSDNNFNSNQTTQFIALAVDLDPVP